MEYLVEKSAIRLKKTESQNATISNIDSIDLYLNNTKYWGSLSDLISNAAADKIDKAPAKKSYMPTYYYRVPGSYGSGKN